MAKPLTRWRRWRYLLEAGTLGTAAWLVRRLPYRGVYWLGQVAGTAGYYLFRSGRRIARENLDLAFGQSKTRAEKQRVTRASFRAATTAILRGLWSPGLNDEIIKRYIVVNQAEVETVRRRLADGKGLILYTMHYGDWELLAALCGFWGISTTIIAAPQPNPALDRFFKQVRERWGNRIVAQRSALRQLLRCLRGGEAIALLIDLNAPRKLGGIWLEFFGKPVYNTAAPGALALRTGAPVIPIFARPLPRGKTEICILPEIRVEPTGQSETDLRALNQECLRVCEDFIRACPQHWLWTYPRWKNRPGADPSGWPTYSRFLQHPTALRRQDLE